MPLQEFDFPLIVVDGCVISRSRGLLFSAPLYADDVAFRLNKEWLERQGRPAGGGTPQMVYGRL